MEARQARAYLSPRRVLTLESAIEFIAADDLVEKMPST
jgi:predicted membrane GTPase involved in stress response